MVKRAACGIMPMHATSAALSDTATSSILERLIASGHASARSEWVQAPSFRDCSQSQGQVMHGGVTSVALGRRRTPTLLDEAGKDLVREEAAVDREDEPIVAPFE